MHPRYPMTIGRDGEKGLVQRSIQSNATRTNQHDPSVKKKRKKTARQSIKRVN